MATTADIKNGLCIDFKNDLWQVVEFQHVKPGKGAAFVRTKLKNLKTGKVLENTFPSGTKIDTARVERRPYQFLYKDDTGYNFMHTETFEQITIPEFMITNPQFLKEGTVVEILIHAETETPLVAELPVYMDFIITYTEPGVKGDTATNAMKDATIDTGATIRVPLFINEGEKVRVDTRSGEYSNRVNN
ncbi:MAG: elongation factor P [Prevotellaceae bacterium]|jgi:elongation factor P|nr:elongation factor P [Prevotellaceae bacterium]